MNSINNRSSKYNFVTTQTVSFAFFSCVSSLFINFQVVVDLCQENMSNSAVVFAADELHNRASGSSDVK